MTLDAIHDYGPTEPFNEITLQLMKQFSLETQLIHVDTTNFSVYGKYEGDAELVPRHSIEATIKISPTLVKYPSAWKAESP
jgi:hypothetical protein